MSSEDERVAVLVQREVRRIMQEQQQGLLQTAAVNSRAIVESEIQASTSQVRDTLDAELEKV